MTTTLITSGTGKTGRRVAELLTDLNHPIKIGSRSGRPRFDWNDDSTWKPALEGCASAYLAEAVREIGDATGRDLSFGKVSGTDFVAGLQNAAMPSAEAYSLAELFTGVLDGHNAYLSDGVRQALGRGPRDFVDYVRRTAQTGVRDG